MQTNTPNNANEPAFPSLTARQYAAIHLRVPMADEAWLNDMITEARRWDAAQAAMQGLLANGNYGPPNPKEDANQADQEANALTHQMKGGEQ